MPLSIVVIPASGNITPATGGSNHGNSSKQKGRATQATPRYDLLKDVNEPLAVDIEFQEFRRLSDDKWSHRIGRIAIVNTCGVPIYDVYSRYPRDANIKVKMPPADFGVTYEDLKIQNGALPSRQVEDQVRGIIRGRTIIMHGSRLDKKAVGPQVLQGVTIVDTQDHSGHTPIEDAAATMLLYLRLFPFNGRKTFKDGPAASSDNDTSSAHGSTSADDSSSSDGTSSVSSAISATTNATSATGHVTSSIKAITKLPLLFNDDEFPALGAAALKSKKN